MAKKRINAKKIAKMPLIKKRLAKCVVSGELYFNKNFYTLAEMLYTGHRGFLSYNEKELIKVFEKNYAKFSDKEYAIRKKMMAEKRNGWRNEGDLKELMFYFEESKKLMEELIEDILL